MIDPQTPTDLPAEWLEQWRERAAIREYDGGQPRADAERHAFEEILVRMEDGNT